MEERAALSSDDHRHHLSAMAGSASMITLDITGMTCAGCASRVEKALAAIVPPDAVTVNLPLERADIGGGVDAAAAIAAVRSAGYGASLRAGTASERKAARERREAERRAGERMTFLLFVVSALLTLPFMLDMSAAILGYGHGALLSPWVQLALAIPVQFVCGWRFLTGAAKALWRRMANMDVLVALGTLSAFGLSTWRVVAGHADHGHALYFEGAAAVITFVLLGKVLEANARSEASDAVEALGRAQETQVLVHRRGSWVQAPTETLTVGEHFAVRPGQRAAADGLVTQGVSDMDESLVSGESLRQPKAPGAKVIAGAVNGNGMLTVQATAVGDDSTLARIARLVEAAQVAKAPAQRLADRVSQVFVPAVLAIAVVTALAWWAAGAPETAIVAGISVLVVACPCALGLATPIALVAGTGAAAKAGILVRDIGALEAAARVDAVAFDKTGTLTEGRPRITAISAPGVGPEDALRLALALSHAGGHPLAEAVQREAGDRGIACAPAANLEIVPGRGVKGDVEGVAALFGSAEFLREQGVSLGVLEQAIGRDQGFGEAETISWLAGGGRVVGAFAFSDQFRNHAEEVVRELLDSGLRVVLLSGDRKPAAEAAGRRLGIAEVKGALTPGGKVRALEKMKAEGRVVAMVGDGLNDTPALSAAEVGIAMAGGTDAAGASAGISLLRPDLRLIPLALKASRETEAVIRQNLWLAFLFNGVGIPLAAFGQLTPAAAGAAMAASSVSVVLNALRLSRRTYA
jgi:Cu+-exporting ATPase